MKTSYYQWLIMVVAVVVVILSWTVFRPEPKPIPLPTVPVLDNSPEDASNLFVPDEIVAKYEVAESGAHRLLGNITLPELETGCYNLKMLSPAISEDGLTVNLKFRTELFEEEKCVEVEDRTKGTWAIAVNANKDATFTANFNWQDVPLVLNGR